MSKLNIGSDFTNNVLLNASIAFSVLNHEKIKPAIVAKAKDIDLFGNLGISIFSSTKNFFSPFFMNAVVIYVSI